jgi:hypothetical protein
VRADAALAGALAVGTGAGVVSGGSFPNPRIQISTTQRPPGNQKGADRGSSGDQNIPFQLRIEDATRFLARPATAGRVRGVSIHRLEPRRPLQSPKPESHHPNRLLTTRTTPHSSGLPNRYPSPRIQTQSPVQVQRDNQASPGEPNVRVSPIAVSLVFPPSLLDPSNPHIAISFGRENEFSVLLPSANYHRPISTSANHPLGRVANRATKAGWTEGNPDVREDGVCTRTKGLEGQRDDFYESASKNSESASWPPERWETKLRKRRDIQIQMWHSSDSSCPCILSARNSARRCTGRLWCG